MAKTGPRNRGRIFGKRDFCAIFHFSSVLHFTTLCRRANEKTTILCKKTVPKTRRTYSSVAETATTMSYSRNCRGLKNPQKTVLKNRRIYSRIAKTAPRNRGRIFGKRDFCAIFLFRQFFISHCYFTMKLKNDHFVQKKPSRTSAEYIRE